MSRSTPPRFTGSSVTTSASEAEARVIRLFEGAADFDVDERLVGRVRARLRAVPQRRRPLWVPVFAVTMFALPAVALSVATFWPRASSPKDDATASEAGTRDSSTAPRQGGEAQPSEQAPALAHASEPAPLAVELEPAPTPPAAAVSGKARDLLKAESESLAGCLALLGRGDTERALSAVVAHQARFPRGLLQMEATLVRLDALRALGRSAELLASLDRAKLSAFPRSAELLSVRGRLRAAANRCTEAASDLGFRPSAADQELLRSCQKRAAPASSGTR